MIHEASTLDEGARIRCDICVVGAGAAGISLALRLVPTGHQIVLMESGFLSAHAASQRLYAGASVDTRAHSPPDTYRRRQFGGSTTIWGGQCVPFDPLDFEPRDYLGSAGWPITFGEVARYYPEANAICEAGPFAYSAAAAGLDSGKALIESLDEESIRSDSIERFSRPTDFGRRYREELKRAANVRVLLGANAVGLEGSEDGATVRQVAGRTLQRNTFSVACRLVVLAMGGLEVPRLLLWCGQRGELRLGDAADHVGRNYMCHIAGVVGELKLTAPVFHDYETSAGGIYCRRRFTVRPKAQCQARMGNFAARLHFTDPTNPAHRTGVLSLAYLVRALLRVEHAKRLQTRASVPAHLRNLLCDAPATAKFLARWIRRRTLARRKLPSVVVKPRSGCFSLDVHAEQVANRQSRVSLGHDLDALGIPEIRIDWHYTEVDMHTVLAGVRLIGDAIRRSGVGDSRFDPDEVIAGVLRHGAYGGHHIGTTRMSESPATGVVDANCRVHGIQNLFVAGSAVFPSSSQAPPTLTVVALALRLADHLDTRLRSVT